MRPGHWQSTYRYALSWRPRIAYLRRMHSNPPDLRPDLARARIPDQRRDGQPTIGMVSLGCPKA
ncbi:MAG: hypothetical protein COB97_11450, partial [Paracoccus sp.]